MVGFDCLTPRLSPQAAESLLGMTLCGKAYGPITFLKVRARSARMCPTGMNWFAVNCGGRSTGSQIRYPPSTAKQNSGTHIDLFLVLWDQQNLINLKCYPPFYGLYLAPVGSYVGFPVTTRHASQSTRTPISNAEILGAHRGGSHH